MPWINKKVFKPSRIPTTAKKAYIDIYNSPSWKKLRAWKVRHSPLCEDCLEKTPQLLTPVQEVHHIRPWINGYDRYEQMELAFDPDNLVSLCIPCHKLRHKKGQGKNH